MKISIQGIRGIPAKHGGFETFADNLTKYLIKKGDDVLVYCQEDITKEKLRILPISRRIDGALLVYVPVLLKGAIGTVYFDICCILDAICRRRPVLTLGYNTALFNLLLNLFGISYAMNMDGIEWKRQKWGVRAKLWLLFNEFCGAIGSSCMIADNPHIASYLIAKYPKRNVVTIPYGANPVYDKPDPNILAEWDLVPNSYAIVIARPEPENSIYEIVNAFLASQSDKQLVVLGSYSLSNKYCAKVLSAAAPNIKFIGAVYDVKKVTALRYYSLLYLHGHQVGGTNPSLVEAMAAGQPILAFDSCYNRWVLDSDDCLFKTEVDLEKKIRKCLVNPKMLSAMSSKNLARAEEHFSLDRVNHDYRQFLIECFRF